MTMTVRDAQAAFGTQLDPHLDLDTLIPVITGLQFQGDVAIIPLAEGTAEASRAIPAQGVDVVRGGAGGHAHTLIGQGFFDPDGAVSAGLVRLGVLTVPPGQVAYLAHAEHGYSGIGPGSYELRRQREMREAEVPVID